MFWIEGSNASIDRIQVGVNAAHRMCYEYDINPHKALLANKAKHKGEPYNKQLAAAWTQARDICLNSVYGEAVCWERGAKFTLR